MLPAPIVSPIPVGLDDGYAYTKLALPNGRVLAIPSQGRLGSARVAAPIAVVDIGGRTTDFVVVADQAVIHSSSGSLRLGLLDAKREVAEGLAARFDCEVGERTLATALARSTVRLFGDTHDVSDLTEGAMRHIVERIHVETRRKLGRGAELERILFVGGGAVVLAAYLKDWFPNQSIAPHPAFANARGMLKYLRYVSDAPTAA